MIEPFTFLHSARRVIFAWDGIAQLKEIAAASGARRAAIVIDAVFCDEPLAERLAGLLALAVPAVLHFVPRHEPDTESTEACRAFLAAAAPDLIVAVGGGSAMDTAKVARMLLANPGPVEAISGPGKAMLPHASMLICVPTTAGTGSEVSESAILGKAGSDVKLIYRSPEMTAQVALLDPALTVSAPPGVTAASGYDAVTHAVEAFVSRAASPLTDPIAEAAVRALSRWLPVACADPASRDARGACLIASAQGAIAFNSANLGLAHAIAAPLGALHHVGHGLGNALALPAVTAFNEPALGPKGAVLAAALQAPCASEGLSRLRHRIGLDQGLDDYVPDDAAREQVARAAMRSGQVRMNPRSADIDQMRAILAAMRRPTGGARPELAL